MLVTTDLKATLLYSCEVQLICKTLGIFIILLFRSHSSDTD